MKPVYATSTKFLNLNCVSLLPVSRTCPDFSCFMLFKVFGPRLQWWLMIWLRNSLSHTCFTEINWPQNWRETIDISFFWSGVSALTKQKMGRFSAANGNWFWMVSRLFCVVLPTLSRVQNPIYAERELCWKSEDKLCSHNITTMPLCRLAAKVLSNL